MGESEPPSNAWFIGPTEIYSPKSILIGSAVFAGLTIVTDKQTDRRCGECTLCLRKRPTITTWYNFYIHNSIATIFGTNIAEKVGNQNLLYFPTSP